MTRDGNTFITAKEGAADVRRLSLEDLAGLRCLARADWGAQELSGASDEDLLNERRRLVDRVRTAVSPEARVFSGMALDLIDRERELRAFESKRGHIDGCRNPSHHMVGHAS